MYYWKEFHTKITAHCRFPILKNIIINMSIIYKVHEFTGDSAIVTGYEWEMFLVVFTFFFLVILLLVQRGLSQAGRDKVNY